MALDLRRFLWMLDPIYFTFYFLAILCNLCLILLLVRMRNVSGLLALMLLLNK